MGVVRSLRERLLFGSWAAPLILPDAGLPRSVPLAPRADHTRVRLDPFPGTPYVTDARTEARPGAGGRGGPPPRSAAGPDLGGLHGRRRRSRPAHRGASGPERPADRARPGPDDAGAGPVAASRVAGIAG